MRHLMLGVLAVAACTANVSINKTPLSQRVSDACADLDSLCASTGTCSPRQVLCQPSFTTLYQTEDACKTSCADVRTCIKSCKATRMTAMGDITATCSTLSSTCSTTGEGCTAGEFFCSSFAMSASPCSTQLQMCKAACTPHDRTCLKACRDAYKQCVSGGTTMDAGVPDAPPTTTPDAAPDAPMTTPDAPTTTTSYTYTTDIAPKMSGLCNGCHSGTAPPGNYLTDSYTNLFGNGSDNTPNIIPGDANSLFVQKIAGNHHNVLTLYPGFDTVARDWVVNNNAAK